MMVLESHTAAGEEEMPSGEDVEAATTKIQASFRGKKSRDEVRQKKVDNEQGAAATKVGTDGHSSPRHQTRSNPHFLR